MNERKIADLAKLAQAAKEKEQQEREKACFAELTTILEKHRCELRPTIIYAPYGMLPDIKVFALPKEAPKPINDRPTTQPTGADASIAGTAKAGEQAERVGEPIAPSKVLEASPQA